jgi:hypothetical protein
MNYDPEQLAKSRGALLAVAGLPDPPQKPDTIPIT